MKKFLSTLLLFILPLALLIVAIELYVLYYPSTFNRKADYIKSNAKKIQTVILGSSHNQNALDPEFLRNPAANLANAGQDTQLDSAMFFHYVPELPSLKNVVIEIDYLTMEEKNDAGYFRLPWYYRFFGIKMEKISLLNKMSVYASSPAFFNKILVDEANPKKIRYKLNEFGFITNDFPGVMEDLHYDTLLLAKTAGERLKDKHTTQSLENFSFNRSKLNAIIQYASQHTMRIILLSTPMYSTYIRNELPVKNIRRHQYIDSLASLQGVSYYDFENDPRFAVRDFKNDDHLNSTGAKKYSLIIDSIIQQKDQKPHIN